MLLNMDSQNDLCPKCGGELSPVTETSTGRRLQRCSQGTWNAQTKKNEGCDYVKWLETPPQELDEKCPKCGASLILQTTRFGKKMKKCSTGGWDAKEKKATGCDFVEWVNGTTEPLDEKCPLCSEPLVLFTTTAGKKMEKCSTAGWDRETKQATGCKYVKWLNTKQAQQDTGEEFLPPEE